MTSITKAAARQAQDLYRYDGADPSTIMALRSAFEAGARFAQKQPRTPLVGEAHRPTLDSIKRQAEIARTTLDHGEIVLSAAHVPVLVDIVDDIMDLAREHWVSLFQSEARLGRHGTACVCDRCNVIRIIIKHIVINEEALS